MGSGSIRRSSGPILARSESLEAKFTFKTSISSSPISSPMILSNFASSSSSFSSVASSSGFFNNPASSQPWVTVHTPSNEFRFSIDRSNSPSRSISATKREVISKQVVRAPKKTCMCSPTTHPGSFRCSMHKRMAGNVAVGGGAAYNSSRLYARRSAMTNSLVRIGTVEGDLLKRALAALIRPSSHQQRRRSGFQPRPTRLSVMSIASEET